MRCNAWLRSGGHVVCAAVLVVLAGPYGAPRAAAAPGSGGSTYVEPEITAVKCAGGDTRSCAQGALLRLSGNNLAATRKGFRPQVCGIQQLALVAACVPQPECG